MLANTCHVSIHNAGQTISIMNMTVDKSYVRYIPSKLYKMSNYKSSYCSWLVINTKCITPKKKPFSDGSSTGIRTFAHSNEVRVNEKVELLLLIVTRYGVNEKVAKMKLVTLSY